jgi:hypothetical protein
MSKIASAAALFRNFELKNHEITRDFYFEILIIQMQTLVNIMDECRIHLNQLVP